MPSLWRKAGSGKLDVMTGPLEKALFWMGSCSERLAAVRSRVMVLKNMLESGKKNLLSGKMIFLWEDGFSKLLDGCERASSGD